MKRLLIAMGVLAVLATSLVASPAMAAPDAPNLIAPNDGVTLNSNPVLEWEPVTGAVRYTVQVATAPSFSSPSYSVTTYNTKATPPSDLPQGLLYWRVRGIDAASASGPYSSVQTFTKDLADSPEPIAPTDGSVLDFPEDTLSFSWEPVPGAKNYEFQFDTEDQFLSPVTRSTTTTNTTYTELNPPTMDQPYFWRVRAKSPADIPTLWSAPIEYSMEWTELPTLIYPEDNSTEEIEEVVLEWSPVDGAATYDIQVSPNEDFTSGIVINQQVMSTRYSPAITINNDAYYWRVRARNSADGPGDWSNVHEFTRSWPGPDLEVAPTPEPPPGCVSTNDYQFVELCTPAHNSVATNLEFEFTPVELASGYTIQMSKDQFFGSGNVTYSTNHTRYTPADMTGLAEGVWYWRVRPIDEPKPVTGIWSATATFELRKNMVTPIAPADGTSVTLPVLEWESKRGDGQYEVTITRANDTIAEQVVIANTSYVPQTLVPAEGPFTWSVKRAMSPAQPAPDSRLEREFTLLAPPAGGANPDPLPAAYTDGVYSPLLTWERVANADRYEVVAMGPGSAVFAPLQGGEDLDVPGFAYNGFGAGVFPLNRGYDLASGEWTWKVNAYDGITLLSTGDEATFEIRANLTTQLLGPDHCDPSQTCNTLHDTPTLRWNHEPGTTQYRLTLSRDINFTNTISTTTVYGNSYTPPGSLVDTQAGQATYWYVRPFTPSAGPEGGSFATDVDFTPVRAFKKSSLPLELVSPAVDEVLPDQITFTWRDYLRSSQDIDWEGPRAPEAPDVREYRLHVSTEADFTNIIDAPIVDQTTYTAWEDTYPDGPLYWRVQARDGSENFLTWSETRVLSRESPVPAQTEPSDGAVVGGTPLLAWDPVPASPRYQAEIYENPVAGQSIVPADRVYVGTTSFTSIIPPSALPAGEYGWRVRRLDSDGRAGPWSAVLSNDELHKFTVSGPVASLIAPDDGGAVPGYPLLLEWSSVPGATQYRVQTSTVSNFLTTKESQTTVMNSWAPVALYADGLYYWRVLTLNSDGDVVGTSDVHTFTKGPVVPGAPTGATAVAGAAQATVSWNAPSSDGGSPITGYTVTASPGPRTCTTTGALSCVVTGLTNDIAYTFTVRATNVVGMGPASAASNSVTPTGPAGDLYNALSAPVRIQDSRPSTKVGPYSTPWGAGATRDVTVADIAGVPSDADAVTLNVTVTDTTGSSHLVIWPKGQTKPVASSLNWEPGWTVPNAVTVKVGTGGQISIYNNQGNANVIVDVVGFYKAGVGAGYTSLTPVRIQDSRSSSQVGPYSTPWGGAVTRDVTVAGAAGVPADASAVVLNTTVTGTTGSSNLVIWPKGSTKPVASSLNWVPGWTIPNAVTVRVGSGGQISIYNNQGSAHVIVDVVGYFKTGTGSAFHPMTPVRIQDSRSSSQVGPYSTPWGGAVTRDVTVANTAGVPSGALAVLLNATVTGTTGSSHLVIWPKGQTKPVASSLNWEPSWTIPNAVTAKVGTGGQVSIYNNVGSAHVIVDVAGWYG